MKELKGNELQDVAGGLSTGLTDDDWCRYRELDSPTHYIAPPPVDDAGGK